jgi:23S rRNA pseudouridine2605 synthase
LDKLRDGITIEGIHYGPIEATLEREQGANVWLGFAIREGKNREVRNVLAELGLQVNRLIRVAFGPFGLGDLAVGAIAEVETKELREQLGAAIIAKAGCDFAGPVAERPAEPPPNREQRREKRHEERRASRDDRDRPREGRRSDPVGEHAPAPRERDERRPFRKSRDARDERPEKPPGRPRRGHAWRKDDAPLRRTYRGSRRDELKIADEARPDKRAGLLTDKTGRRVLVERFGTRKEKPEPAPVRGRAPRSHPPRDRASGPRPSRPRFAGERPAEPRSAEPRQREPRIFGLQNDGPRNERPRTEGPRNFGPRKFGAKADGPRSSGPRKGGPGKFGPRPPRPSGSGPSRPRPPGSRPSGPRPPRDR